MLAKIGSTLGRSMKWCCFVSCQACLVSAVRSTAVGACPASVVTVCCSRASPYRGLDDFLGSAVGELSSVEAGHCASVSRVSC